MNNTVILEKQNILDLSKAENLTNLLIELNDILERNDLKSKKIKIVLGNLLLNHAQICSIKTILESADVEIEVIYTSSVHTQLAVLSSGLAVSEQIPELSTKADTFESQDIQEIICNDSLLNESVENENQENNSDGPDRQEEEVAVKEIHEKIELVESVQSESIGNGNIENNSTEQENADEQKVIKTFYLKQTLRSGQLVDIDGNVVIIGDCKPGSEIIASGDITIWGILSGIAHAGSKGDYNTSIRALKIDAIQLRIADLFARKPDKIKFEKVEKPTSYKPEEARISQGEIIIYPLNE